MSIIRTSIAGIIGATILAVAPLSATPAFAGVKDLVCNSPFKKVSTQGTSIKCRNIKFVDSEAQVQARMKRLNSSAGCNAHSNPVKFHVFQIGARHKVQASFTCGIIY